MSAQDLYVCKTFVSGPLSAPPIPLYRFFARYKLVTYLRYCVFDFVLCTFLYIKNVHWKFQENFEQQCCNHRN